MTAIEQLLADHADPPRARFGRAANSQRLAPNVNVAVEWDTVDVDTEGVWDSVYPSRITVPAGMALARAVSSLHLENRSDYARAVAVVAKNGSWSWGHQHVTLPGVPRGSTNAWAPQFGAGTGWISAAPGEYFELIVSQTNWTNYPNTPASVLIVGAGQATWLEVEFRRGTA